MKASLLASSLVLGLSPLIFAVPPTDPDPVAASAPAPTAAVELATVNGKAITTADVEKILRTRFGPQLDSMPPAQRAQAIQEATPQFAEELISRALLLEAAKDEKLEQGAVDEIIDNLKGNLPTGLKFEDYLEAIKRDEADLRAEMADESKINKHLTTRLDKIAPPTDEAVAAYYEENKAKFVTDENVDASHILLKTDPAAGEEGKKAKRAELEKLRAGLIKAEGKGFDELAKEHSDCPSGQRGGSLGTFRRGQMVPEFDAAAFSQKPGEIGEIIETQFGYHIVKVTAKTEGGQQSLDDVKEGISQQLDGEKRQSAVQDYLKELEAAAKVTRSAALTPPAAPEAPE